MRILAVKTPNKTDLEYQLNRLVERFDHFTDRDAERWSDLHKILTALTPTSDVGEGVLSSDDENACRFLKANDLFGGLPNTELAKFIAHGELRVFAPGEWVFRHGSVCDQVVAIREGILEIRRDGAGDSGCAALLGVGEVLGMLGVMTGGLHRSSARFPEGGEVFVISAENFDRALDSLPLLSASLARSLARRLIGAVQKGDMSRAKKRHLEGSLAHFDLSTVLQSLFSTDACEGILQITNGAGEALGEIVVGDGRVLSCRAGKLLDRDAFHQLFLADNSENRFNFVESSENAVGTERKSGMAALSGAGLLMDCARIADELERIRSGPLGDLSYVLKRADPPIAWDEPATQAMVREIWGLLGSKQTVGSIIAEQLDQDHLVYRVLYRLMEAGHIK